MTVTAMSVYLVAIALDATLFTVLFAIQFLPALVVWKLAKARWPNFRYVAASIMVPVMSLVVAGMMNIPGRASGTSFYVPSNALSEQVK